MRASRFEVENWGDENNFALTCRTAAAMVVGVEPWRRERPGWMKPKLYVIIRSTRRGFFGLVWSYVIVPRLSGSSRIRDLGKLNCFQRTEQKPIPGFGQFDLVENNFCMFLFDHKIIEPI